MCRFLLLASAIITFLLAAPVNSNAQDLYVANYGNAKVEEYNAATGAVIRNPLIANTNSNQPTALALWGNNLYVGEGGYIAEFNATTGALLSSTFALFSYDPQYLGVSGGNLFATGQSYPDVAEFNAQTGATESSNFIGSNYNNGYWGLTVSGNYLYVAGYTNTDGVSTGYISVYNATSGALVTGSLAVFAGHTFAMTISGSDLYVSYAAQSGPEWSEFNTTTGAAIAAFTIPPDFSSEGDPSGLAVSGTDILASFGNDVINEYNATTGARITG
jgi:hypothetical protein